MPCMQKGLQRQKGVGPLVSSQEQRALLVPLINRCENMLNFPAALVFNGWFASGVGFHPRNAAGRARTGASEARIGHTPINL